jgi:heat shock protein HslJ
MNSARAALVVLAIAAAAALGGCSSGTPGETSTPTASVSASPTPSPSTSESSPPDSQASVFVGAWGEDKVGQPSLTIASDGAFNGTDGCNSLAGQGMINGDTFEFGSFASTLMACQEVDAWLAKADTATVSGDTMTVLDKSGTVIGTLTKR